jgi:hypothetical protein
VASPEESIFLSYPDPCCKSGKKSLSLFLSLSLSLSPSLSDDNAYFKAIKKSTIGEHSMGEQEARQNLKNIQCTSF